MNRISQNFMRRWLDLGPKYLPFADAASPDVPLSRLLRLSLLQVSVGMSLVLMVGTLNRVMIVELGIPASLVAIMLSLPIVFAPFRALIGFKSDTHQSALGWKRVPFIYRGTMLQFCGLAIMPFAILVLSGGGHASEAPAWIGKAAAALSFLMVGAGIHTTQTAGLALATDLTPEEKQPNVVGLMYVMLLAGSILSALAFGKYLETFDPVRLVACVQSTALAVVFLNAAALWKQEALRRSTEAPQPEPSFSEAWQGFAQGENALRRLAVVGLGTMAFGMQDVLLEPYGGEVFHLSVSDTTKLTATLAGGGLLGFTLASKVLSGGFDPFRMAAYGTITGIVAFALVILSSSLAAPLLFSTGVFLIGLGGGLFGHGTLTATMNCAPKDKIGLALGAWGAVQATTAGVAVGLGGLIRDLVQKIVPQPASGSAASYNAVYALEIVLLFATLATMISLIRNTHTTVASTEKPGTAVA